MQEELGQTCPTCAPCSLQSYADSTHIHSCLSNYTLTMCSCYVHPRRQSSHMHVPRVQTRRPSPSPCTSIARLVICRCTRTLAPHTRTVTLSRPGHRAAISQQMTARPYSWGNLKALETPRGLACSQALHRSCRHLQPWAAGVPTCVTWEAQQRTH